MHSRNFHECLKRPLLQGFLCFSDRPIGNLRRRSKETERSNYSPSELLLHPVTHLPVCVPILVVLYDECQGTTKKKAINADLLFSATLLLALFSCGFPTTNRCTAVFYYAEELGHLGDHCHTSIICFWAPHNWYWKIPIYWQDFKNVWKSSQMSHLKNRVVWTKSSSLYCSFHFECFQRRLFSDFSTQWILVIKTRIFSGKVTHFIMCYCCCKPFPPMQLLANLQKEKF